ncbi:MAG: adenylate/guanylate cyclase domain-containing protein [Candidatus Rokubacteria bacterium]|nr:adenylate/guanylate cyclase domain-containing protein [Candidatus Rokubacteria bacterium]
MFELPARWTAVLAAVAAAVILIGLGLAADVGRPYPGFLSAPDFRVFPVDPDVRDAGLAFADRIVSVDGASPATLHERVRTASGPVRYDVERSGVRFSVVIPPRTLTAAHLVRHFGVYFVVSALMLVVGAFVLAQKPGAGPNRRFAVYMALWALSNVATPEAVLGLRKLTSPVVSLIGVVLSVHGAILFLTYPVNPARLAWLERRRAIPRLYAAAAAVGLATSAVVTVASFSGPETLARLYGQSIAFPVLMALASFPVKVWSLIDTRRRAGSPLVDQQTTVLLAGIGLGLGSWLLLMLLPLVQVYEPAGSPQLGSALVLLYPAAIAYATVRYRLFDATLVIRRSLVYTVLAALVAGAYALAIAAANVVLARAELARSPWFSAAFMFTVALVIQPLRSWVQNAVDRTFFRERQDHIRALQSLARSMRGLLDLEEIIRRLASTIESAMHVRDPRLYVGPPAPALSAVVATAPGAVSRYQVAADPSFGPLAADALHAYAALGADVIVPLRFQDELRGLLVLGPKRSEAPYTAEDLALLETVADQAAIAVANAEAHRQVVDYARELERSLMIRSSLAKFVPRRVHELIEASPDASLLERRETDVTVVFADISGYTRLSSRLTPDELGAIVERYFGAFLDEIVKHGGDVNETAGDGLMVIFHEGDHARAAAGAAREIHRRAAELNADLPAGVEPLRMHIGINSGPAALGATKIEGRAGTRWTYTASGMTTNVAARLAAVAQGGEIVVSEATLARLGGGIPAEDLGERALKNVDRPMRIYRL